MKLIILLSIFPLYLFATVPVWNDSMMKSKTRECEEVFSFKVIDFTFKTLKGKVFSSKEYDSYINVHKHIRDKIYALDDSELKYLLSGEQVSEDIRKMNNETKAKRVELLNYYQKKLEKFPLLNGEVKAKCKILKSFKGNKKEGEKFEIEFVYSYNAMCPHPIQFIIDRENRVWFSLKKSASKTPHSLMPEKYIDKLKLFLLGGEESKENGDLFEKVQKEKR